MDTVTYKTKSEVGVVQAKKSAIIERELTRILEEKGVLSPAVIVDEARDEASPLHPFFEWRDDVAAEKYRQSQAMAMILATKMVCELMSTDNKQPTVKTTKSSLVRSFLPFIRGNGFATRPVVLNDQEVREAFIARKKGELKSWCASVIDIPELVSVREALEKLLE